MTLKRLRPKGASRQAVIARNGVVLALLVGAIQFLQLPEGLFLALAVLTVVESNLGGGAIAGRERLLGSLIGLLAVVIASGALQAAPQPLQVFSGLSLVRWFGFALGLSSGYVVGGHMVAGSLLHDTAHWWHYAFWRTVMTLIGVLIGVVLSRQIYSQRATSDWEDKCNHWLLALAAALVKLAPSTSPTMPDSLEVFERLRDQRNQLRQVLPQLLAEQSVLEAHNNQALLRAQILLQHGSTVLSCVRDLTALQLNGVQPSSWLEALPVEALIKEGAQALKSLAEGHPWELRINKLRPIHAQIESRVAEHLSQSTDPSRPDRTLEIASRLLLLGDALSELQATSAAH